MSLRPARVLLALVTAVTALASSWVDGDVAAVAGATGSTSWTVSNPNSDGSFTIAVEEMVLTNTPNGDVVMCPDPAVTVGTLRSGTYSGEPLAEIGELSADYGCTDATGTPVTVHQLPWRFQAEYYDPGAGQTRGVIFSHSFVPFVVERPGCTYLVVEWFDPATTLMEFSYTNPSATLTVGTFSGPALAIGSPTGDGCVGLADEGDIVSFSGTYTVSPAVTIVRGQ